MQSKMILAKCTENNLLQGVGEMGNYAFSKHKLSLKNKCTSIFSHG